MRTFYFSFLSSPLASARFFPGLGTGLSSEDPQTSKAYVDSSKVLRTESKVWWELGSRMSSPVKELVVSGHDK